MTLTERFLGLECIGLLQIANLGSDALTGGRGGGENAGEVGVMIAANNLRGQRVVNQAQVLADIFLDKRLDGAVRADSARDGTKGNVLAGILLVALVITLLNRALTALETRLVRWH